MVGTSRRLVEEEDIPQLSYLQAVVKETLRLYPPVPVTIRESRQSCKIGGRLRRAMQNNCGNQSLCNYERPSSV